MKRIDEKFAALKAAQENGKYTLCPRCGRPTMKPKLSTNALSRIADIMVCDECGADEAKLAWMNADETLYTWAGLRPECPPSDFKDMTGEEVWEILSKDHAGMLINLFERYLNGESGEEIRLIAFESCPGLTEMWTEPYRMDFMARDGKVAVRFKRTDKGSEMSGALIPGSERK